MILSAFRFMKFDKAKTFGLVFGILLCTFLIGQQISLLLFHMDMISCLVNNTEADIWVIDNVNRNSNQLGKIDERYLKQVQSIEGVAKAYPIVIVNTQAKFADGQNANVFLVGSEAPMFVAGPDTAKIVAGKRQDLLQDYAVSADFYDAMTFGGNTNVGTSFEINGKKAIIKAQTKGVRGLAVNFLYTTLDRAKYYGNFPAFNYSAIAIKVKQGYPPEKVAKNINQHIFGVRAWQASQIREMTVEIVLGNTGIGVVFMLMVVFAVISGLFIIAISMYSTVIDRIKDYGTLKAIGATNGYIARLILTQAILYALVGYILATIFLELFKIMVADAGILLVFHLHFRIALLLVTVLMAVLSSTLAIRRVVSVEPAMVFRG
jgi:putative ABC transport system permease protein